MCVHVHGRVCVYERERETSYTMEKAPEVYKCFLFIKYDTSEHVPHSNLEQNKITSTPTPSSSTHVNNQEPKDNLPQCGYFEDSHHAVAKLNSTLVA